jgi:ADP-ribose pyrophosphatase YjhB (NUDIX family)
VRVPAPLGRAAYRIAYFGLRVYSLVFRPRTRGVKLVICSGDEVLLVRHSYGPRAWDLPGGFCRRNEPFADAARREAHEELGVEGTSFEDLGEMRRPFKGRRETLRAFRTRTPDQALEAQSFEIAKLGWFRRDALPERRAPVVEDVLALERRFAPVEGREGSR